MRNKDQDPMAIAMATLLAPAGIDEAALSRAISTLMMFQGVYLA